MRTFNKILFLLLLVQCNHFNLFYATGFIEGTLIKTKSGYIPIEQLKEKSSVISYDLKNNVLIESEILEIQKKQYFKTIKLSVNGTEIIIAPDQKIFCPLRKGNWIEAKDLKQDDLIVKNLWNLVKIEKVEEVNCDKDFYSLSLKENHNFFVSEKDLFIHNIEAISRPVFYTAILINRITIIYKKIQNIISETHLKSNKQ